MDIRKIILDEINKKGKVKVADIINITKFSRTYINRFLKELQEDGQIILLGKSNQAHYIKADKKAINEAKTKINKINKILLNENLAEDLVLKQIKDNTGIYINQKNNIIDILDYCFLEILNNAIEHSQSKNINIKFEKNNNVFKFKIIDTGIGIFNNIMLKKNLSNQLEAVQDLLKGKQTTSPKKHSGEGIFFTSKLADVLTIESSTKKLIFNNLINDIFINEIKKTTGTKVTFTLSLNSKNNLEKIFKKYTDDSFSFSKTHVVVKLYEMDNKYISRSQARRIVSGLNKFKTITLDYKNIKTIGQAFADEIYRIWQKNNPNIKIINKHSNENIDFMINRAKNNNI